MGEGWFSPSQNSCTHSSAPLTSLKGWREVRRTSPKDRGILAAVVSKGKAEISSFFQAPFRIPLRSCISGKLKPQAYLHQSGAHPHRLNLKSCGFPECQGRGTSPLQWEEHRQLSSCAGKSFPQRLLPSTDKHPWVLPWLPHACSWEEMFPLMWGWSGIWPEWCLISRHQSSSGAGDVPAWHGLKRVTLSSLEQPLAHVGFVSPCLVVTLCSSWTFPR